MRSGLQHWYPEVAGTQMHSAVESLLGEIGYFERHVADWIEQLR